MSETEFFNQPERPPAYGFKVALAATCASCAVAAIWVPTNLNVPHPELWLAVGFIAAWLAFKSTLAAMKAERQTPRASFVRGGIDAASRLRSRLAEAAKTQKVEAPAKAATPDVNPLEAERERLRKAGYSAAEISQIMVARESGAGARKAALGAGVATGVLNNLDAVMTHLRSLVPSVKFDLTRMLDRKADSATRISGAVSFGVKVAAAVMVGYFVYLEALQFRSAAYKSWAEACIERQKSAINFSSINELMSGAFSDATRKLEQECKT
jgi:hypothetical protein